MSKIDNFPYPNGPILFQGLSDGGPPKSVQVNFLFGRNDFRTAIEHA